MGTITLESVSIAAAPQKRVIGIGEMILSNQPDDVLVTYSLGSCVGLALYDPVLRIGGLVHCMLPLSNADPERAERQPGLYTDSGVCALLEAMLAQGSQKRRIIAKAAGGAAALGQNMAFKIGQRNQTVLRKVLWKNNVMLAGAAMGGEAGRTLYLRIADGMTVIRSQGVELPL